jgi:hypothetical protein
MMTTKISCLFLCLLCSSFVYGQEFTYEVSVKPVQESAYYRIVLSPKLLGKLNASHSDLRIYSRDGVEQPYLLRSEVAMSTKLLFKEYKIVDQEYIEDTVSYLIFHNPDKQAIDNVSFVVRNTNIQKRAKLSGSDDQENWYVIKDNYLLHSMQSSDTTSELKILSFPLSNYEYFRLEINDNLNLPINILKVGYYDYQKVIGNSAAFNFTIVNQKDSLKKSYIKLALPEEMYLEKLKFELSGSDYYSRSARVLLKKERVDKRKKRTQYLESISSFNLNSNSSNEIELRGRSVDELYVEIRNKDNQPLIVDKVIGSFLNQYMVVELQENKTYVLRFGNKDLNSPDYDLGAFEKMIPVATSKISHGEIKRIEPIVDAATGEGSIFDNKYLIWLIIGGAGVFLGWISMRMVKEIGKK